MYDALVGSQDEIADPEEIELKVDDTEFWEWNYCLVYSNPDSHKVMRYMTKQEAVTLLKKLTISFSNDKSFA